MNAVVVHLVIFVTVTSHNTLVFECAVFVKRFVSLSNDEVIFNVSSHVVNLVKNNACFFINFSERSFNEAVFVNLCKCCKV